MDPTGMEDAALYSIRINNERLVASGSDLDIPGARGMRFVVPPAAEAAPPPEVLYEHDAPMEAEEDSADCVGCMFGQRKYDQIKAPLYARMVQLLDEALFSIPNPATAATIYKYYEHEIRQPILLAGGMMPLWTPDDILHHLKKHMDKNPDIWVANTTEDLGDMRDDLRECMQWHKEERNADEMRKTVRTMALVIKLEADVRQLDTKKMWGYSKNGFRYDPKTRNQLIHLTRIKVT